MPRRQALWDARTLVGLPDLPLFAHAQEREEGAERAPAALPAMPLSEEVVADYQTTRLSLKAHPLAFLRPGLEQRGFVRCADLRQRKPGSSVRVAGVVLIRQRPGSAKGVCFITLEDETGIANLVIWPDVMERFRKAVMVSRLMEVRGRVEYDEDVLHVIATHLADATDSLHLLSDDLLKPAMDTPDHVSRPLPAGRVTCSGIDRPSRALKRTKSWRAMRFGSICGWAWPTGSSLSASRSYNQYMAGCRSEYEVTTIQRLQPHSAMSIRWTRPGSCLSMPCCTACMAGASHTVDQASPR